MSDEYDELHAAPNRELWDVLATSQGVVYSAVADKDQAVLVFNVAVQMIRNDTRQDRGRPDER